MEMQEIIRRPGIGEKSVECRGETIKALCDAGNYLEENMTG
jgi:hypothetical protein